MSSTSHKSQTTASASEAVDQASARALQNGASGEPFNVGIIIAIIIGGIILFGGLIWLSNKQRGRWAAHEHKREFEEADKKGSLPTYSDIMDPSRSKGKGKKMLLLPSRGAGREQINAMEEGCLPSPPRARGLNRPPQVYNKAPGRLQPFQGV